MPRLNSLVSTLLRSACVVAVWTAPPLLACALPAPFVIEDIKSADAVIVGTVTDYNIDSGVAFLTIDVERSLVGDEHVTQRVLGHSDEVRVGWRNSTFQLPEDMPPERRIFALRQSGSVAPPLRGPSGVIYGDPEGVDYFIVQAPCSRPFSFPFSHLGMENIQAILDGNRATSFDYHNPESGYMAAVWELRLLLKIIGLIALLLALGCSFLLIKNRRLKKRLREQQAG